MFTTQENLKVKPIIGGHRLISDLATVRADFLSYLGVLVKLDAEERLLALVNGAWVEVTLEMLTRNDWVGEV